MPVPGEDYDANAPRGESQRPHGFEDQLAFVKVVRPGVEGVEAPITREGDGGDDDFPFYAWWGGGVEVG